MNAPDPSSPLLSDAQFYEQYPDANLGDYIDRRAKEIADPLIAKAGFESQTALAEARDHAAFEEQRCDDLVKEFRRQITALERRAERAEAAREETLRHIGMHPDQIAERERNLATTPDDREELLARIHAPVLREAADRAVGEGRMDVAVWLRDRVREIEAAGKAVRGCG